MKDNTNIESKSTKDKITDTALELFANQGYHKTSINQIAKSVGVSKSLIYNYFESKEDLLDEIVRDSILRGMELVPHGKFDQIVDIGGLLDYMKNMVNDLKSHPSYYRLLILLTLQGTVKQKLVDKFMKTKSEYMPQLFKIMENHQVPEPEKMTYLLAACFDGLILHYLYMEDDYPIDELFHYFSEKYRTLIQTNK